MSDQDVNIRIKTSADTRAAKEAARSIADIERELRDARAAFKAAEQGSKEFTASAKRISELTREITQASQATQTLGRRGNAGAAVLEFSRAFEDAQYGIRGVLNNIPSLVSMLGGGMGLAGVLSIAAVAGTKLWEMLGDGAKKSKNPLADYNNLFKTLVDHFDSIEQSARNARALAFEKADDEFKADSQGIDDEARKSSAANALSALKEQGQIATDMANERVRLAGLEQQLATATGEEALRLAKLREESIARILGYEREMSDAKNAEALKEADTKINTAFNKSREATEKAEDKQQKERDLVERQNDLLETGRSYAAERIAAIKAENDLIEKRNADLEAAGRNPSLAGEAYDALAFETRAKNAGSEQKISKLLEPGKQETSAFAEAKMISQELASIAPDLKAAVEDQAEAARELLRAVQDKNNLENTQVATGVNQLEGKQTEAGGLIKTAMLGAVDLISKTTGGNPLANQEAAGRIKGLVNDDVPDQEQGGQMAGILQGLANNMSSKDQKLIDAILEVVKIVKDMDDKVKNARDQIDDLKSKVNGKG